MGISSKLFYSTDTEKQTLHRRIVPTDDQQAQQQERWNDLMDFLAGDLGDTTGYPISSWLQGSYKFATQIRPPRKGDEFDIDLGVYFGWAGSPHDGEYGPLELKSLVQKSLEKYKDEAGEEVIDVVSPPKTRCSRIRFTHDFHIDVPSYHLDSERDLQTLATEEDIWEDSDPKALYEWFNEQYADPTESSLLRRLIRYFKMWAALNLEKENRPSSILLSVLVVEALREINLADVNGDDLLFGLCAKKIVDRLGYNQSVINPVNHNENLDRMSELGINAFRDGLDRLVDTAKRALSVGTEIESATIWQEVFNQFFPFPIPDETDKKNLSLVPVKFDPQVFVKATPINNKHHSYTGENRIGPIPKGCALEFSIANASQLPTGARMHWIARNEGEEAEYENDLGHLVKDESVRIVDATAYKGTHFMDLVVKSAFGEILGFRRIPVEVSGMSMPPRNPRKKPGYRFKRR